jgi:hypothetical protein
MILAAHRKSCPLILRDDDVIVVVRVTRFVARDNLSAQKMCLQMRRPDATGSRKRATTMMIGSQIAIRGEE